MNFLESMRMAFSSLWAHKLRSMLTMLGIIIGVFAVITIVTLGKAGEEKLKSFVAGTGNNTLDVQYELNDPFNFEGYDEFSFSPSDVYDLEQIPEISQVITTNTNWDSIEHRENRAETMIVGISRGYYDLEEIELAYGRLIDEHDIDQARRVIIIEEQLKQELFEDANAIGEIVEINNVAFQVVGVLVDPPFSLFNFGMQRVIIPISVWPMMYGVSDVTQLTIQAIDANHLELAGEKAVDLLNNKKELQHGKFTVLNFEQIQEGISQITNILTGIFGGIAAISLIVGGIGVMNIMLVSVTERTKEIGIRKSMGATRQKILLQFLIEAMTLTTIGGSIGIVIGILAGNIISLMMNLTPVISPVAVFGGLLFSMVIGVVFGLMPANKAAKMNPIDALRYE